MVLNMGPLDFGFRFPRDPQAPLDFGSHGTHGTHWISVPEISGSKPLGSSKIDSAFHPSKVDEMSTTNSWGLVVKSKLSPNSGSVALRH